MKTVVGVQFYKSNISFSPFHAETSSRDRLPGLPVKQQDIRTCDVHTCLLAELKGNASEDHACQEVLSYL